MHMQPVFSKAAFYGGKTSARLFEHGLCLPSGSNLTDSDFDRITDVMDRIFGVTTRSGKASRRIMYS
jgi:dTDP-4-amino-4,6-dideoxygalactose transaminase